MARLISVALFALLALSACAGSEGGTVEDYVLENVLFADRSVESVSCEEYEDATGLPENISAYDCHLEFSTGARETYCGGVPQGEALIAMFDNGPCRAYFD